MRQFDAATAIVKNILIEKFGETKFETLTAEARKDFEELLPQIPYVGGNDNRLTDSLINAVTLLPLLRLFEREGLEFHEIGDLTYRLFEAFYKVIPPAGDIFSKEYIDQEREQAKLSRARKCRFLPKNRS